MEERNYRLPCGAWVSDVKLYCDEWDKVTSALEAHYGLKTIALDPGVTVMDKNHMWSHSFSLPMWFVQRLLRKVDL